MNKYNKNDLLNQLNNLVRYFIDLIRNYKYLINKALKNLYLI